MTKKAKFLIGLLIVTVTTVLVTCKPITYYLERVYKAYGKVSEAGTGIPLESVEVFVGTYQYSTLTNGLGDYGLELAEGTWVLSYVKDGYNTETRTVTVSAQTPRVKVDVVLTRPGFTLSGAWASPSGIIVPDGIYGYLKLVANGAPPTDQALYWTRSSAFSGGSASYAITGITAGTYAAYAFIDMNANAPNDATAMPDSMDCYLQAGQQAIISGNQTLDLGSSGWVTPSPEASWTMVGTWVNPSYDSGGQVAKEVITTDSVAVYAKSYDTTPLFTFYYTLTEDWIFGGAHYFKAFLPTPIPTTPPTAFLLIRVSGNNTTIEGNGAETTYPAFIDTADSSYGIYFRQ